MRKFLLHTLLIILSSALWAQSDVTSNSAFKNIYYSSLENNLITLSHNYKKRAEYKIKTIVKEKILPKNFLDSLIGIDPIKNFIENHIGTIEYSSYNKNGHLSSYSLIPLNVRLSSKDSAEHRYIKVKNDSIKREYIIDYYFKNVLLEREIYSNDLLKEKIEINERLNISWQDDKGINHDTISFCDVYIKYKYDNTGLLISREYNNTEYFNPQKLCDIVEFENYIYKNNEIFVTKIPYQETKKDNDKYINEITKNKNGQVVKSIFYANDLNTPFVMYSLLYDKKNNLKDIYESYGLKDPYEVKLYHYENIYNNGILKEIIETCPGYNMRYDKKLYFFNKKGLLEKVQYIGEDWQVTEMFTYTFY